MYIAARPKSIEQLNNSDTSTGYSFINKMQFADVYLLSMRPMTHGDFSSYGLRLSPDDPKAEYSREEVVTAHNWSMRYVQQFLQAYLKDDGQALAFLQKPATENGTPRHMMTIEQRKGKLVPPSFERLALELRSNGYAQAPAVYQRMQQSDAGFSVSEPEMNAWAYSLQRAGYVKDAIEVLKLAVGQYPASANLYDSLGDMYESDGQKAQAIASYRHSLELDAGNANAVQHLRVLEQ
jgi:tetratricopeptide (TPR) repeat protein